MENDEAFIKHIKNLEKKYDLQQESDKYSDEWLREEILRCEKSLQSAKTEELKKLYEEDLKRLKSDLESGKWKEEIKKALSEGRPMDFVIKNEKSYTINDVEKLKKWEKETKEKIKNDEEFKKVIKEVLSFDEYHDWDQ